MKGFTRRQLLAVVSFALVFVTLFLTVDRLLFSDVFFSDTWTRIRKEQKSPQVLILGNSHSFCSFVPQIINDSLGLDAAVLGASGQNSAGAVDSFEAVLAVDAPEIVVAEVNVFLSPYDQAALYHKASMLNNINGMPHLWQRVKSAWRELGFEAIPQGAFQLLRADLMWARWNKHVEIDYAADGSSLMRWRAQGVYDAAAVQAQSRSYEANAVPEPVYDPRNEQEFRRMMDLARKHGVRVVLVKAPTVTTDQLAYNQIIGLEQIAREYGDVLLGAHNFHSDLSDMDFGVEDFYDPSHLSRSGAARFTIRFATWLGELLGTQPDFGRCFAYAGERVEPLADGMWRYSMYALGENVTYRFSRIVDGEEILLQDFGPSHSIVTDVPLENADQISVTMRMGDKTLTYTFMTVNTCTLG